MQGLWANGDFGMPLALGFHRRKEREEDVNSDRPTSTGVTAPGVTAPFCAECGTQTVLKAIVPDIPHFEKRTFECPKCHNSESKFVKTK